MEPQAVATLFSPRKDTVTLVRPARVSVRLPGNRAGVECQWNGVMMIVVKVKGLYL